VSTAGWQGTDDFVGFERIFLTINHQCIKVQIRSIKVQIGLDVGYNRLGSDYVSIYACMYALV
jgi:hypothetical protein